MNRESNETIMYCYKEKVKGAEKFELHADSASHYTSAKVATH